MQQATKMKGGVSRLVKLSVLAALSVVLMLAIRFPFPGLGFLEYDPADIPILIGSFLFGPLWGLLLTVVVSAIQALTVSAASGWMGFIMHVFATGAMVLVAGSIYKRKRSRSGAVLALCLGALTMVAFMIPLNLIVTPLFLGIPASAVAEMLIPMIIPFNLLKAGLNSLCCYLLYKRLSHLFSKL